MHPFDWVVMYRQSLRNKPVYVIASLFCKRPTVFDILFPKRQLLKPLKPYLVGTARYDFADSYRNEE